MTDPTDSPDSPDSPVPPASPDVRLIHSVPVLILPPEGDPVAREQDALDLIGEAGYRGAHWAAVPAERFAPDFLVLRTRLAGDVIQKFVQYGVKLAVVGDITAHVAASTALRDFVRECNRGTQTWFVTDLAELEDRLK
ncbi:DUF4180 domain-containing protein [Streptomyces sp. KLOTTS4A1]|uniref:DUF4180 domain-containing protein n=1 Tax=Streptomyces sp. KLOTTS4A1 TaxID=3390996 RepID=UPI0039F5A53D